MDLTAEFYLQTVETVFITHALPKGEMMHHGKRIDTTKIRNVALFTVEGEKDDISGVGQTQAAHRICPFIPKDMRAHYVQPGVGHYGVFNGSRFRSEIAPRIADFIATHRRGPVTSAPTRKANGNGKAAGKRNGTTAPKGLDAVILAKPQGAGDDLTRISGVGPKIKQTLNKAGIFHFWQLAGLSDDQLNELDGKLSFKGRAGREDWVDQAKTLAKD